MLTNILNNKRISITFFLMIIIFSITALYNLPVKLFPNITGQYITVVSVWPNSTPNEIEKNIISIQEEKLNNLEHLINMNSSSVMNQGILELHFDNNTDLENIKKIISEKLNNIDSYPKTAIKPTITSSKNTVSLKSYYLISTNNSSFTNETTNIIKNTVFSMLRQIKGIKKLTYNTNALPKNTLLIKVNPFKLQQYNLTYPYLKDKIQNKFSNTTDSIIEANKTIRMNINSINNLTQIKNTLLKSINNHHIYLKDVAEVVTELAPATSIFETSHHKAIPFSIYPNTNVNSISLLNHIENAIKILNKQLKSYNYKIISINNDTDLIKSAIGMIILNIMIGTMITIFCLFLIFKKIKLIVLTSITIPLSIAITFILLSILDRSLNIISLIGIAFAVGMVIDASLIVLESILFKMKTHTKDEAISKGVKDVYKTLFASTLTTIIVFFPIFLLKNQAGQLFTSLGITISSAIIASLIISLTVIPFFLKHYININDLPCKNTYQWTNKLALKVTQWSNKKYSFHIAILMFFLSILYSVSFIPKLDYLPKINSNHLIIVVRLDTNLNINSKYSLIKNVLTTKLAPYLNAKKQPFIKKYRILATASSNGFIKVIPENPDDIQILKTLLETILTKIPGQRYNVYYDSVFKDFGGIERTDLNIQSTDPKIVNEAITKATNMLSEHFPKIYKRPYPSVKKTTPELSITLKEDQILKYGWHNDQFIDVLKTMSNGLYLTDYFDGDLNIPVYLKTNFLNNPFIDNPPLYTPNNKNMFLLDGITVKHSLSQDLIYRINGRKAKSLLMWPEFDITQIDIINYLQSTLIPEMIKTFGNKITMNIGGEADQLLTAFHDIKLNFFLAIFIVLIILILTLNSLKDALLITATVPFATFGSILMIQLINLFHSQKLDLMTMIGFIIMLGLIVNNAILLITQTRYFQKNGEDIHNAIHLALKTRMRSIIVSTLTTIFGMLPILLIPNISSLVYQGLAGVIIGGIMMNTLFTLFLIPSILKKGF